MRPCPEDPGAPWGWGLLPGAFGMEGAPPACGLSIKPAAMCQLEPRSDGPWTCGLPSLRGGEFFCPSVQNYEWL